MCIHCKADKHLTYITLAVSGQDHHGENQWVFVRMVKMIPSSNECSISWKKVLRSNVGENQRGKFGKLADTMYCNKLKLTDGRIVMEIFCVVILSWGIQR